MRVSDWSSDVCSSDLLAKLKSTYTDALVASINPKTGRVHTSYSIASTNTGRFASNDPNLQNIPVRTEEGRKIRKAFVADKRSEEHTSELQSLMRISYAVFCLKKKKKQEYSIKQQQ